MGWLIPKTLLKWWEPWHARRTREALAKPLPWYVRPLLVLVAAAMLMLSWWLAHFDPAKHPPPLMLALLFAPLAGVFLVYVLPFFLDFVPYQVKVTDRGILLATGGRFLPHWEYEDISLCRIATDGIGEKAIAVLELAKKDHEPWILGIPRSISLDELERILLSYGVPVERICLNAGTGR